MSVQFVEDDLWPGANFEFDETEFLPLTEGDILLAFLVGSVGDDPAPPAGWTQISQSPVDASAFTFFTALWGYVHVIGPSDTGVYDFTNGDGGSLGWSANFVEYSGADPDNPIQVVNKSSNGNTTPALTLPSIEIARSGGRLLVAEANQIVTAPTVELFTLRTADGPMYVFDRGAFQGETGDIDVVSANESGTGWDLGFLIALNPPVDAGVRFDCSSTDSQIN